MFYISDLMEEATEIMLENLEKSENTRIFGEEKLGNAESVGISALMINDLKQKTSKDYNFSWGKALAHSVDAGVKLQHSRLKSLVEAAKVSLENSDVTSLGVHCPRACLSHCSL